MLLESVPAQKRSENNLRAQKGLTLMWTWQATPLLEDLGPDLLPAELSQRTSSLPLSRMLLYYGARASIWYRLRAKACYLGNSVYGEAGGSWDPHAGSWHLVKTAGRGKNHRPASPIPYLFSGSCPRAVDAPSLDVPKAMLDGALCSLSWWVATSPWQEAGAQFYDYHFYSSSEWEHMLSGECYSEDTQ